MTAGHRHRHVQVKRGGRVDRVLRKPLFRSRDLEYVERSRFVWGGRTYHETGDFTLSLLGILHPLTGLSLRMRD